MLANDTPHFAEPVDEKSARHGYIPSLWVMETFSSFTQPTPKSVSLRLRTLRKSRGWTLHDIEAKSEGSIKAVVMGSYERGTRAISLARCLELANLFAIPISELLAEREHNRDKTRKIQRFDLRQSAKMAASRREPEFIQLHKFLIAIAQRRGDWNGEILTLRTSDVDTLTLLLEMRQGQLEQWLQEQKITLN
jgi:transcriptional regulator with XRE-family HTH domain